MDRTSIAELTALVARFRDERDWAQFHTLRNLIVSLNLEAAELLELTQWKPCLLYTSPSPRDGLLSRMPSSA